MATNEEATTGEEASRYVARLKTQYEEVVVPALIEQFGFKNRMQVPKLDKIVINIGMGEAVANAKSLDNAVNDLTLITGQRAGADAGEEVHRAVQDSQGHADRRDDYLAGRADVRVL